MPTMNAYVLKRRVVVNRTSISSVSSIAYNERL